MKDIEQEPVAYVTGVYGGRFTYAPINPSVILPVGMAFYTHPDPDALHAAYMSGFYDGQKSKVKNT